MAVRGHRLGHHVRARHPPHPLQHGGNRGRQADGVRSVPARAHGRHPGGVQETRLRFSAVHRGQQTNGRVPDRRQGQSPQPQAGEDAAVFRQTTQPARRGLQLGVPQRRRGMARFTPPAQDHPTSLRQAPRRDRPKVQHIHGVLPRRAAGEDPDRVWSLGARGHGARDGVRLWPGRALHHGTRQKRREKPGANRLEQIHRDAGVAVLRQEHVETRVAHVRGPRVGAPGSRSQRRGRRGPERGVLAERAGYNRQKSKVGAVRRFAGGDDLGAGTGFSPRGWAESVGGDRAGGVADGSTETGKDGDQGRALTCVVTS